MQVTDGKKSLHKFLRVSHLESCGSHSKEQQLQHLFSNYSVIKTQSARAGCLPEQPTIISQCNILYLGIYKIHMRSEGQARSLVPLKHQNNLQIHNFQISTNDTIHKGSVLFLRWHLSQSCTMNETRVSILKW